MPYLVGYPIVVDFPRVPRKYTVMSADNAIYVIHRRSDWAVWCQSYSDAPCLPGDGEYKTEPTEEAALTLAKAMDHEFGHTEYGVLILHDTSILPARMRPAASDNSPSRSIPRSRESDVLDLFWQLLQEVESRADAAEHDVTLRSLVAGAYDILNDIQLTGARPVWEERTAAFRQNTG